MVSLADHLLPIAAVVLTWFVSTGIVAMAAHRTSPRHALVGGAAAGLVGLILLLSSMGETTGAAAYLGFIGALFVWGWLELAFLTGAMANRAQPLAPGVNGWRRFVAASRALLVHELALVIAGSLIASISMVGGNMTGAAVFGLLFVMRLSTKINIFLGVPNLNADLLPPQLAYLKSYFGRPRVTAFLPISLLAAAGLTFWLGRAAMAAPSGGEAVSASLLFALAALGLLEHLFLALPMRETALWRWALPGILKTEGDAHGL